MAIKQRRQPVKACRGHVHYEESHPNTVRPVGFLRFGRYDRDKNPALFQHSEGALSYLSADRVDNSIDGANQIFETMIRIIDDLFSANPSDVVCVTASRRADNADARPRCGAAD